MEFLSNIEDNVSYEEITKNFLEENKKKMFEVNSKKDLWSKAQQNILKKELEVYNLFLSIMCFRRSKTT